MAVAETHGLKTDGIPAMASGFCGGMARTDGPCGALIGGIMALGLLFGRKHPDDSHHHVYALTERLVRDFVQYYGSRNCSDLLGCNISTREGEAIFHEKNLAQKICFGVTVKTADMVAKIIENRLNINHTLVG